MELHEIERILKEALNPDEVYAQGENAHFGVIVEIGRASCRERV